MILITQMYDTVSVRKDELIKTLKKNIENEYIDKIILLNEKVLDLDFLNTSKINQIVINKRLTYKLAFDYAKNNITSNKLVILANSDIWFDNTIDKINEKIKINPVFMKNKVIALSRYDFVKEDIYKLHNEIRSQDAWIFENPVELQYDYNFQLGKPGCDNKIAWIIKNSKKNKVGYDIINPSLSIKSYHEHQSDYRTYSSKDVIPGPYIGVDFTKL